jgi:hypothetical protein
MAARQLITFISTLALVTGAGWAYAHAARPPAFFGMARPPAAKSYVEGEMLVKFKDGVTAAQIAALNAATGCEIADTVSGLGIYRLRLPEGTEVPEMIARYEASGLVAFAEPNHRVSIPALPGPKPGVPAPRWDVEDATPGPGAADGGFSL